MMGIMGLIRETKLAYRKHQLRKAKSKRQVHLEDIAFEKKIKKEKDLEYKAIKSKEETLKRDEQIRATKGRILGTRIKRITGAFKKANETVKKISLGGNKDDSPFDLGSKKKNKPFKYN